MKWLGALFELVLAAALIALGYCAFTQADMSHKPAAPAATTPTAHSDAVGVQ